MAQRHRKILHWDDERDLGNSLIVTLANGWAFDPHPDERIAQHVDGFDTVKDAMRAVRNAPACRCQRCLGLIEAD